MAFDYAQINEDRVVVAIISADPSFIAERTAAGETYIQVTNPGNHPLIGSTHSLSLEMFVPPRPTDESGWNYEIVETVTDEDGNATNTWAWIFTPSNPVNTKTEGSVYVAQYNAYIVPPENDSMVFNEEELRWELPS